MSEILRSGLQSLPPSKSSLENWTLSLVQDTHKKFYAIVRAGNDGGCTKDGIRFEQIVGTPQSHHIIEEGQQYFPLMQYYFTEYITKCLETSPVTSTQRALLEFLEKNKEVIADFIAKPGVKAEADWKVFDEIFSLREIHSYIGYIHERTKELTQKLDTDQHLQTDLFVNMSNMLHCLYRLYEMSIKKSYAETR